MGLHPVDESVGAQINLISEIFPRRRLTPLALDSFGAPLARSARGVDEPARRADWAGSTRVPGERWPSCGVADPRQLPIIFS